MGTSEGLILAMVGFQPVRDAYSSLSQQYVALFDRDWQAHEDDRSLIRRHLTGRDSGTRLLNAVPHLAGLTRPAAAWSG